MSLHWNGEDISIEHVANAHTDGDALVWFENANGLAEIAVNRGRADRDLGIGVGSAVEIAG